MFRGVPQIEVTLEVDVDGILQVRAEDKAGKKSRSITITNDKGSLSQAEIETKIREAEEFAEEDKRVKERIEARNKLEGYVLGAKTAEIEDQQDKDAVDGAVREALEWLEENHNADKEDYDEKLREVEAVCAPIITRVPQKVDSQHHEENDDYDL